MAITKGDKIFLILGQNYCEHCHFIYGDGIKHQCEAAKAAVTSQGYGSITIDNGTSHMRNTILNGMRRLRRE